MFEQAANALEVSRKRRKCDSDEDDAYEPSVKKPSLRGIKKQARYVPGVPMTKEELTAWRKEARRVRNRESAAASRNKTRQRIVDLEEQVEALQSKYAAALERIQELEAGYTTNFPLKPATVSPPMSPVLSSSDDAMNLRPTAVGVVIPTFG